MGYGRPVLLSDIPENREVGGDVAVYFKTSDVNDLEVQIRVMLDSESVAERGRMGAERVRQLYSWDDLARRVEVFYQDVLDRRREGPGV